MATGGQDTKDEFFLSVSEEESERKMNSIAENIRFYEGQSPLMGSEAWRKSKASNHEALKETITVEVGKYYEEMEIADCKVTFDQGTFTDIHEVTITAEVNPENWPPGREAVTPMLHVDAHKLLRPATVKLHTWCAFDGLQQTVEVMRYNETNSEWESIQFCTVSESRYIEFSVGHFSWVIAVLERFFSASYIMRPIVYCSHTNFVLALLCDTKLQIQKFHQEMNSFFISGYAEMRIQAIECKKDDEIKTLISCIKPASGFQFLPRSMCIHSVRYIVTNCRPSYRIYNLTSDKPSQVITIEVESKKDNEILSRNCFGFCWNGDKGGAPQVQVVNVHGTAYLADGDVIHGSTIGTLNKGEIRNENHGVTSVVTGQKHTTTDSTTSVEMAKERNCERKENAVDSGPPNEEAKDIKDRVIQLEDQKRKLMLEEGDFIKASEILAELQALRGHENVDDLLDIAVCELHLLRGRDESTLRNLKDHISKSPELSAWDARLFGRRLARVEGRFVAAIIMLVISHDLRHQERRLTLTEETEWRLGLLSEIRELLELLDSDDKKLQEPAIMLGKEAVEILERDTETQREGYDDQENSVYRDETDVQNQAEKEKEERMKILEDQKRRMTFEEHFKSALGTLTHQQQQSGELDDVIGLLKVPVSEFYSMRNRENIAMKKLKDYISKSSSLSAKDVKAFGCKLARSQGSLLPAMIFLNIYHLLRNKMKALSKEEEMIWRKELLSDIREILELSGNRNSRSHRIAANLGLEIVEKLEQEIRGIEDVKDGHSRSTEDRSTYPVEKVTEVIGREGKTIEIGGCSVTFPPDCFEETQKVTITAAVNPNKWPSGRVGIAPSLDISAPSLKMKVKVKLTTWYLPDDGGENSMVEVLAKKKKEWIQIHSCSVYASRTIEFEAQHFCLIQAVLRMFGFDPRYSLRSVVYYSKNEFAVAVILDDKMTEDLCLKEMKDHFKTTNVQLLRCNTFACKESNVVESRIHCEYPNEGFTFLPDEQSRHSIWNVFYYKSVSTKNWVLLSERKSQKIVIIVQLTIDGILEDSWALKYNWETEDESAQATSIDRSPRNAGDSIQIVAENVNLGNMSMNKTDGSVVVTATKK